MTREQTTTRPGRAETFSDGAVTVAEAVRFSGVGRSQLYRLMTRGELPFAKVGARRLIPRRGLIALLANPADPDARA
jgi:excisionase family DNA binding protein